ncbi:g7222 [Coccomyxa elongata]
MLTYAHAFTSTPYPRISGKARPKKPYSVRIVVSCEQEGAVTSQNALLNQASRRCLSLGLASLTFSWGLSASAKKQDPVRGSSGDWSSPGLAAPVDDDSPRFFKTPDGVKIQELAIGKGSQVAKPGDQLVLDYVLRRANGYFIYATVEGVSLQPRDVPTGSLEVTLGSQEIIPGLEEVLEGMRPGGRRRALIPPELGYAADPNNAQPQPPTFATKRQLLNHSKEPLLFEVELLRIRRPGSVAT